MLLLRMRDNFNMLLLLPQWVDTNPCVFCLRLVSPTVLLFCISMAHLGPRLTWANGRVMIEKNVNVYLGGTLIFVLSVFRVRLGNSRFCKS